MMIRIKRLAAASLAVIMLAGSRLAPAAAAENPYDFSENNLATNTSYWDPSGYIRAMDDGGNDVIAASYFARWAGPVCESDDPFPESGELEDMSYSVRNAAFHVQDIAFLPMREHELDNDEIKKAVMNYGAVCAPFWVNTKCFNKDKSTYYLPVTGAANIVGGHEVAIVGWDDNYSRKNFVYRPKGNGAFICKNSWGTESGDNGYFYVSYYDALFAALDSAVAYYGVESRNNYDKIYQYDLLGPVSSIDSSDRNTAYQANVFPQQGEALAETEDLCAVSFYTQQKGLKYDVYVVTDYKDPDSLSGGVLAASGISPHAGYQTVEIDAVKVRKGTRFAVVVKLTNTTSDGVGVFIETPITYYSDFARANAGESFYRFDNTNWEDVTDTFKNTNVCVKAFTKTAADDSARPQAYGENRTYASAQTYSAREILRLGGTLNEAFVKAAEGKSVFPKGSGLSVPSVIIAKAGCTDSTPAQTLPAAYDLRDTGCVTSVKDQMYTGTCWAFAALASVESCLIKKEAGLNNLIGSSIHSVTARDMKVSYKKTFAPDISVNADPGKDYNMCLTSSDPEIVSVENGGMLYSRKVGSAVITATITNFDGNVFKESFKVRVKYSFWQQLIRIFLLGFLWY